MSDRLMEAMQAQAEARENLQRAEKLCDEAMEKVDAVDEIVLDGPEMLDEDCEMLSLLPDEKLAESEENAERVSENVRDYLRVFRKARELKARRAQGS